jgi:hypothetical protein
MSRTVNPIVLLGLIIFLILSLGILANAQLGGGSAGDAIAVGEAQLGKPFVMATDGPNTFSCVGLMRHILRTIGVDGDAPWAPEAYLSKYTPVDPANLQPGDIVIYPGWATMYVGNGMLLNANEVLGTVTHTPMSVAGVPLGIVRPPYAGSKPLSEPIDPLAQPVGEEVIDPLAAEVTDPMIIEPVASQPTATEPVMVDLMAVDPLPTESMSGAIEPVGEAIEPMMQY